MIIKDIPIESQTVCTRCLLMAIGGKLCPSSAEACVPLTSHPI